jgi:hypothetical protein
MLVSNQRTPVVSGISYVGADGKGHVTVAGEKITVAADDVAHFDWIHDATPEAREARFRAEVAAAEKAAAPKASDKG